MGLFTGAAPPDVTKTQTTASTTPDYYTNYLTQLSQTGQNALGTYDPTTKQFTAPTQASMVAAGSPYVADLTQEQKDIFSGAPTQLTRYQDPLTEALTAGKSGMDVSQADISKFYNPYENAVVGGLATQSAQNVQRNLMPQLKAGFVGTGGLGSSRYANAMGQTMGDVNTGLLQEQNKTRMAGYNTALDAAMKEAQLSNQAASALTGLGQAESQAATSGLKTGAELGALEQAYTQAQINAPLTQATNVAQLMKGYTVPTTQLQTYKGPGDVYQPSPLSQIASLGTLLASGFNSDQGFGNRLLRNLGVAGSTKTPDQAINDYFKATGKSPFDVGDTGTVDYTEGLPSWLQDYYNNTSDLPPSNVED
jgi:hypothetical protein